MRCLLWLWILLSSSVAISAHAESPVRKDLLEMTETSERRIRQTVQDYLGPETRTVVTVYFKEQDHAESQLKTEDVLPALKNDSNWLLSGPYAPPMAEAPAANVQRGASGESGPQIESAEVSIQVEKIVDDATRKEIEAIAKRTLRGLQTKVTVAASLKAPIAQIEKEKNGSRSPASVDSTETDPVAKFIKRFGGFAPIGAGLLVFFGALLVGLLVKSSAKELSESVRAIRPAVQNSGSQSITLTGLPAPNSAPSSSGALEHKVDTKHRVLPAAPTSDADNRKNLEYVERYIFDSPLLFSRSIGDEASDLMGLKFLISKISPEGKTKLKELIGMEKLFKASAFVAGSEVVGFNTGAWIQDLIEKIELKKLAGGTVVEEAVTPAESLILASAPAQDLLSAAIRVNTPPAWRVATDFIPSDFLKSQAGDIDDQMWIGMMKGASISDRTIVQSAARQLIDIVHVAVSENVVMFKANRERDDVFKRRILPGLVDSILSRDLGEDDRFVEILTQEAPEFARPLKEMVWTPRRLDDVDDESLKGIFMGRVDNDKRALLLFIFPEKQSQRLERFLPDGNGKKIVLDIVAKYRERAKDDKELVAKAKAFAREFLDALRSGVLVGAVKLKEGALDAMTGAKRVSRAIGDAEVVEADPVDRKAS